MLSLILNQVVLPGFITGAFVLLADHLGYKQGKRHAKREYEYIPPILKQCKDCLDEINFMILKETDSVFSISRNDFLKIKAVAFNLEMILLHENEKDCKAADTKAEQKDG